MLRKTLWEKLEPFSTHGVWGYSKLNSKYPKMVPSRGNIFFLTGIHFMQESAATTRHGFTRKRSTNTLNYTGNLLRKNLQLNSRLKATKIIGQRKPFYRHKIPECSCARKETVEIDILVTSRSGDRKIMQSIRIMSRSPSRKRKWNQLSQFWRTSTKVIPIEKT